jgi:hypothetical protein
MMILVGWNFIRIRIGNADSDPVGQKLPTKIKKCRNFFLLSAACSLES